MSLILDTAPAVASLRSAVATLFKLDPARVEVLTSGEARGVTPVLVVEVRVDGELASGEVQEFVTGLLSAARTLAERAKES